MLSDGVKVVVNPEVKYFKGTKGSDTHFGQFIFDARRHFREIMTRNQPVALKIAERECQHPLSDTFHLPLER